MLVVRCQAHPTHAVGIAGAIGVLPDEYIVLVIEVAVFQSTFHVELIAGVVQAQVDLSGTVVDIHGQEGGIGATGVSIHGAGNVAGAFLLFIAESAVQLPVVIQPGVDGGEEFVTGDFPVELVEGSFQLGEIAGG